MIRYRRRAALYGEVWYHEEAPANTDVDIVVYRQRAAPVPAARVMPFLSLVVDLTAGEDAIMAQFGRDCRYKIKRAESRDGLHMELFQNSARPLDAFCAFYETFASQKGVKRADRQWLSAVCEAGRLLLTSASRNGETLVWHVYVRTGGAAWLQYTASCFRGRESEYRAVVGRANRWLHWNDMLRFKRLGIARYDWGGLFEDESAPERAGINRFKKEFGGHPVRTYDCEVPMTTKGRLWLPVRNAWRSRNSVRQFFFQKRFRAC